MPHPRPALLVACLLLAPTAARAQLDTGERLDGEGHRVLLELGGAERRQGPFDRAGYPRPYTPAPGEIVPREPLSFAGATFALYARARALTDGDPRARLGESGALTLDVEFAARGVATEHGVARVANPLISVALGWATRELSFRVALGAGLPLSSAYDISPNERQAYSMLRASQGHADVWLATEESVPVVLRARLEGRAQWLFAGGDLGGALLPTIPRSGRRSFLFPSVDDLIVVGQVGAWIGARPIEQLAVGLRGQLVVQWGSLEWAEAGYGYHDFSNGSFVLARGPIFFRDQVEAFVTLVPFVRAEIDELTLEGRLYLNLDTPDGVAFDQGATWSATLTAGWTP
jgi:hypothetical protein